MILSPLVESNEPMDVPETLTMRADRTANVVTKEAEIDASVAHLYHLTEEEYALVLKETNCPDPFRVAALNIYRDIARGKLK
jgi:hypothetical protein